MWALCGISELSVVSFQAYVATLTSAKHYESSAIYRNQTITSFMCPNAISYSGTIMRTEPSSASFILGRSRWRACLPKGFLGGAAARHRRRCRPSRCRRQRSP